MAEGNRKDPRARVLNMTVRYKSATVDEFIENHSHDISRGGIFIKTRSPFPAGTLLKFEVRIAEDQKLMHGVGRVVWRREVDRAEESYPAGMGIKFIKTGEGAAELINQLVAARQGAESSFDAGVRESVSTPGAGRPSTAPPAPVSVPAKPATPPPTSSPSVSIENTPRSMQNEAETAVSNPAKKRQDQSPEKRKVVLQGPALEAPPSTPKPSPQPAANAAQSAPSRPIRGSIAEETTARRARPLPVKPAGSDSPKWSGLVLILGLVGLVVFVVNRVRGPAEEEPPPAPTVAAEPVQPAPPLPVPAPPPEPPAGEAAPPSDEAATADPNAAAVQPASATEPPSGSSPAPAEAPAATAPSGSAPAAPEPTPPAAPATSPAPTANATPPAPAPSAAPSNTGGGTTAAPQKPPAPPPPPKPAPAPAKPPAATAPQAAPRPAAGEASTKPPEPAPAPPAAGSGGQAASPTPPAQKPTAGSSGPTPPAPVPPAAAPPAAAPPPSAPPAPPAPPSDDNPY